MQGASMFLQAQGMKDRREQEFWLRKLQENQMKTEGLRQQMLVQQIAGQQTQQRLGQEPSGLSLLERAKMQMEAPEQYSQMAMSEFGQIPTKTVETTTGTPLTWEQLKRYPAGMAEEMYKRGTIGVLGAPPPSREPKFKPEPYVDVQGNVFPLEPGQSVPPGAKPYEKQTGMTPYQQESLAQRERESQENRALREQMHSENMAIRRDLMNLTATKVNRLPPSAIKGISNKTAGIDRYVQLIDSFKDQYAGSYMFGPTATGLYSKAGWQKERVDWFF